MMEKEREWREKEKLYVTDLLKQTKELQEALALTEGKYSVRLGGISSFQLLSKIDYRRKP